jgi:hypothetical protein
VKEISNKTLVILLVIAILVSFGETMLSLTRLGGLMGIPQISGFGTIGEVNVTISQQISLNLTYPSINFGTGYVSPGYTYACLDSEKGLTTGWSSATFSGRGIVIENVGNTDLNVTFNLLTSVTNWVGGTGAVMKYKAANNNSGSCDTGKGALVTTWTQVSNVGENKTICQNLTAKSDADSLDFYVNLTVPDDARGTKGVVITFEGSIPQ